MENYILDSDILIYFLKGKHDVVRKLVTIPEENLFTTRINYAELFFGAYNSSKPSENLKIISSFLENFKILEFDKVSSEIFAKIKSQLKQKGLIIPDMDLMIASISIRNNFTLVSNNIKHFKRIRKLKLVNWVKN